MKPRHGFAYHSLDNDTIHKYTKFEPNNPSGSRVMSIFTDLKFSTDAQQSLIHQKGCYACQSVDNVDMYRYAKFYQNIPLGSRDKAFSLTVDGRTDAHSDFGLCNSFVSGNHLGLAPDPPVCNSIGHTAKLLNVIGLITKHVDCRITLKLKTIRLYRVITFLT